MKIKYGVIPFHYLTLAQIWGICIKAMKSLPPYVLA